MKQFSAAFWLRRGGFLGVIPFPPPTKQLQTSNSKLVTSWGGRLSAHLLSLHNRVGVVGSQSALTSYMLKYTCLNTKALVQSRHLPYNIFLFKFIEYYFYKYNLFAQVSNRQIIIAIILWKFSIYLHNAFFH